MRKHIEHILFHFLYNSGDKMCCLVKSQHLIYFSVLLISSAFSVSDTSTEEEPDNAFLTPLIKQGLIEKAVSLAENDYAKASDYGDVRLKKNYTRSYSGYLTVNEEYNSNLFFWFFSSWKENSPVILWINEKVGLSCMKAVFVKNGPFFFDKTGSLKPRLFHWVQFVNMLYIDSPVGTGFSFTSNESGYSNTTTQVVDSLFEALRQFFVLFPSMVNQEFYIAGETYASIFITSLALKIHKENTKDPTCQIRLKGISLDSPFLDPIQLHWADYLRSLGLISRPQALRMNAAERKLDASIKAKNYSEAFQLFTTLSGEYPKSFFRNFTGLSDPRDLLQAREPETVMNFIESLEDNDWAGFLHAGSQNYTYMNLHAREHYFSQLDNFFATTAASELQEILALNYRVLIYMGQFGGLVTHKSVAQALRNMNPDYITADTWIWERNGRVRGYYSIISNLVLVTVRLSGNLGTISQPEITLRIINQFVDNDWKPGNSSASSLVK